LQKKYKNLKEVYSLFKKAFWISLPQAILLKPASFIKDYYQTISKTYSYKRVKRWRDIKFYHSLDCLQKVVQILLNIMVILGGFISSIFLLKNKNYNDKKMLSVLILWIVFIFHSVSMTIVGTPAINIRHRLNIHFLTFILAAVYCNYGVNFIKKKIKL